MPCSIRMPIHRIACLLAVSLLVFWSFKAGAQNPTVALSEEEKTWRTEHPTFRLGVGVAFTPYMWVDKYIAWHNTYTIDDVGKIIASGILSGKTWMR